MSRIVNTDSTGKQRNQLRRTIAELLRRLSAKSDFDDEARDMLALIVFALREIDAGIESSAAAWEKRDYWMKAEELRRNYTWVTMMADDLTRMVHNDDWDALPAQMMRLFPHFADVQVKKYTRTEDDWRGNYDKLMDEKNA